MWDPYAEFDRITLPNGLDIYTARWPQRNWQQVGIVVHAGSFHDPPGQEELCHLVEHSVARNLPIPYAQFKTLARQNGGWFDLGSYQPLDTRCWFFMPAQPSVLSQCLHLCGTMILNARFTPEIVELERAIIQTEISRDPPRPALITIRQREEAQIMRGCWMATRTRTTEARHQTMAQFTIADLERYYYAHFHPANISVVTLGSLPVFQMVELISQSPLGQIGPVGQKMPLPDLSFDLPPPTETQHRIPFSELYGFTSDRGEYRSVAAIPTALADYAALDIIVDMINDALWEAREQRAIYSTHANWAYECDAYSLTIKSRGLTLDNLVWLAEFVDQVLATLPAQADLFTTCQTSNIASRQNLDPNGESVLHGAMSDLARHHRILPLAENIDHYRQVSIEPVTKICSWLNKQRWTLLVTPD